MAGSCCAIVKMFSENQYKIAIGIHAKEVTTIVLLPNIPIILNCLAPCACEIKVSRALASPLAKIDM
jgi:hypothetical protein